MIYRTYLTNFGYANYFGDSVAQARSAAIRAGFDCVIYENDLPILSHSPVHGWRGLIHTDSTLESK